NDVSAVIGVVPQALEPKPVGVGSVVAELLSVIVIIVAGLKPVQYTGSENVSVIDVAPTAPVMVTVGRVVSGAVAFAWRACGASVPFPAASLIELFAEAPSASADAFESVVSTNEPFGRAVVSCSV